MSAMRPFYLGSALLLLLSGQTWASAWEVEPTISASGRINDNPTLLPAEPSRGPSPSTVYSTIATLTADLSLLSPSSTLTLSPQIKQTWYPDSDFRDLNSTDYFFRGSYSKIRQRFSWSVSARYDYQSLLSSLDNLDPSEPPPESTLRIDDQRTRVGIAPSITWTPSQKDNVTAALSVQTTEYDLDFSGRADSVNYSGNLGYQRTLSARQSIGAFAAVSRNQSEQIVCSLLLSPSLDDCIDDPRLVYQQDLDFDSFSLNLSYNFAFSETLEVRLSYGRVETSPGTTLSGFDESIPQEIIDLLNEFAQSFQEEFRSNAYNLQFSGREELLRWNLTFSQNIRPLSTGGAAEKTQVAADFSYRLTNNLNLQSDLVAYRQESRGGGRLRKNQFLRADITAVYNWARNFSTGITYTFRNRDPEVIILNDDELDDDANAKRKSNQITVTARYRF